MVLPETVPLYVIASEPTAPKVMVLPLALPVMFSVPMDERSMVPLRDDPDSVQVRVKLPLKAPL
jgi:hypothetical protein